MELSNEELDYFKGLFDDASICDESVHDEHILSIKSDIPTSLNQIFKRSKLTLLAEISHYQLWFPLEMTIEDGEFRPLLGIPEIVDIQNGERSWRGVGFDNVQLRDGKGHQHHLISLSSTGIAFRISDRRSLKRLLNEHKLYILLPNDQQVLIDFETVRVERDIIAAKIANVQQGRDRLREFLFTLHRSEHQQLYQSIKK